MQDRVQGLMLLLGSSHPPLPVSVLQEEPITFCEEAFVSHYRSGAMRQFLQNATQLQLFKQVPGCLSSGLHLGPWWSFCSYLHSKH